MTVDPRPQANSSSEQDPKNQMGTLAKNVAKGVALAAATFGGSSSVHAKNPLTLDSASLTPISRNLLQEKEKEKEKKGVEYGDPITVEDRRNDVKVVFYGKENTKHAKDLLKFLADVRKTTKRDLGQEIKEEFTVRLLPEPLFAKEYGSGLSSAFRHADYTNWLPRLDIKIQEKTYGEETLAKLLKYGENGYNGAVVLSSNDKAFPVISVQAFDEIAQTLRRAGEAKNKKEWRTNDRMIDAARRFSLYIEDESFPSLRTVFSVTDSSDLKRIGLRFSNDEWNEFVRGIGLVLVRNSSKSEIKKLAKVFVSSDVKKGMTFTEQELDLLGVALCGAFRRATPDKSPIKGEDGKLRKPSAAVTYWRGSYRFLTKNVKSILKDADKEEK
jgi:hypothetical protein